MKNIYRFILMIVLFMLAAFTGTTYGQVNPPGSRYILYPPDSLQGTAIENVLMLSWEKPRDSMGNIPQGIVGYYVYRFGTLIRYIGDPDSLFCYDFPEDPIYYDYTVTANYDLTSYGFPGIFASSSAAGPVSLPFYVCTALPMVETWNSGNFTFNDWKFTPDQGNWSIPIGDGNPFPALQFGGTPVSSPIFRAIQN